MVLEGETVNYTRINGGSRQDVETHIEAKKSNKWRSLLYKQRAHPSNRRRILINVSSLLIDGEN